MKKYVIFIKKNYMSLALYSKNGRMFIFEVSYEFNDSMFVGFRTREDKYNGNFYEIKPIGESYKVFVIDLSDSSRWNAPIGKKYIQLPGGGGGYKVTRQYNNALEMLKNSTVIKILNNFFIKKEEFYVIRKLIKEAINKTFSNENIEKTKPTSKLSNNEYDEFCREFFDKFKQSNIEEIQLKQQIQTAAFTAVSIEDEIEKKKISDVYDLLKDQGKISKVFTRPTFQDGILDYHMTIKLGELPIGLKTDLNKEVELNIETIGVSNNAAALGVSGDYFSSNKNQHITLGFKGYPEFSKDITTWIPLENPFKVKGIIREFTSRKNIIQKGVFDEANQIQVGNFDAQGASAGRASIFPQEEK